jgi:hypothetical protein
MAKVPKAEEVSNIQLAGLAESSAVFRGRALATRRLTDEVRTSEKLASSCCGASDAVLPAFDPAHFRSAA